MNRRPRSRLIRLVLRIACVLAANAFVASVASDNSYAREHRLILVPVSGRELSVESIRVAGDGAGPVVTGMVKASAGACPSRRQRLEISVFAPGGELLARVKANFQPNPIPADRHNPFRAASYAQRLPLDPPPGSTIRVAVVRD